MIDWKSSFTVEVARDALEGDREAISGAFLWAETEQGHDFWEAQAESGLKHEGREILEAMIAEYEG